MAAVFVPNQVVGKYRIAGELGRGAMGTVFRAVDQTLGRDVAIKVLNPEFATAKFIKRFETEATTLARLNHPWIATIYELVRSDTGLLMVMEFVHGETLETIADRLGVLPPDRAVSLIGKVLSALAYAHRAGIVHCDVKPANIIVTAHGVKIMDFGLARVRGAGHMQPDGYVIGTPAYMAPEQVLGTAVDMRTDLYSVGVMLYRLLTGALPFGGDTPTAMMRQQISGRPSPLHTHRNGLPPWCEPMLQRALAKAPADRFQTAEEFREALAGATGMLTAVLANDFANDVASELPAPPVELRPMTAVNGLTRAAVVAAWAASSANRATVLVGGTSYAFAYSLLALLLTCSGLVTLVATSHPALATAAPAPPVRIIRSPEPAGSVGVADVVEPSAPPADISVPKAAPEAPAPAPAAPPVAFDAKALRVVGKRSEKKDATVVLADGRINVQASDNSLIHAVPYDRVLSISYSRGRDPLWNGPRGPARVARADGGVFGVFRVTRYWVSVHTSEEKSRFIALLFPSDERAQSALEVLEERTGRKARRVAVSEPSGSH